MFHLTEGLSPSSDRPEKKISQADLSKENLDLFEESEERRGPRSSGSKLGLSNLNIDVLNSNFARFERKVARKSYDEDKENLLSSRSLTKIKARPSTNACFTKTSPETEIGRKESNDFIHDVQEDFSIPEFVSSVPQAVQDFPPYESSLPPLPSFYPPPPMFSLPTPLSPPCSPYLPPNYPIFVPSLDLSLSSPSVSSAHSTSPPFTGITASVEQEGFIRLKLNYQVILVLNYAVVNTDNYHLSRWCSI